MRSGIYIITNVLNNKKYVGKSKSLKKRKYDHWYKLKTGRHGNPHLQKSWDRYGEEFFHFSILEECEIEELLEKEKYWIEKLETKHPDKGYNICDPIVGKLGIKATEETKTKISRGLMGHKVSEETRIRLSLSLKGNENGRGGRGKKLSEETKTKISINNGARRPEVRSKMSATKKGKSLSQALIDSTKNKSWSEARRAAQDRRNSNCQIGSK